MARAGHTDAQAARRARVEDLLIDGRGRAWIVATAAAEFGVSAQTVREDIRAVQLRWEAEEARPLAERLAELKARIRRLDRLCAARPSCGGDGGRGRAHG